MWQQAPASMSQGSRRIQAGEWGTLSDGQGSPTFWIEAVSPVRSSPSKDQQLFTLLRVDNAKFEAEYPAYRGIRMLSRGSSAHLPKGLVTVRPPSASCASVGWKRGSERRTDEVLTLTEEGRRCFSQPTTKLNAETTVWCLRYACSGVNTFRVDGSVSVLLRSSPTDTSSTAGNLGPGTIIVADTTQLIGNRRWVQPNGLTSWAPMTTDAGRSLLHAAGCQRQCGGVSMCSASCTMQIKSRHGCDYQTQFYATLGQIQSGLNHVRVQGVHAPQIERWSALPISHRPVATATRDAIIRGLGIKQTAKQTMLSLDISARASGSMLNGLGVCEDRSLVPSMRKIQEIQTNVKRCGRHQPAFELMDQRLRGAMKWARRGLRGWNTV